jgi:hypothetical protein
VVDCFSKYGHFTPINHPYTAYTIAHVFFEQIFQLHGMPHSIVCNRDLAFTSTFWCELFCLNGNKFNLSPSHHPQMDNHKWSIEPLKCNSIVLQALILKSGCNGCHKWNCAITPASTLQREEHLLRLLLDLNHPSCLPCSWYYQCRIGGENSLPKEIRCCRMLGRIYVKPKIA